MRGQPAEATRSPSPSHAFGAGPSLSPGGSEMRQPGRRELGSRREGAGEGLAPVSSALAPAIVAADSTPSAAFEPAPQSFLEVIELFDKRREAVIAAHLKANVRLVSFEPGRIEIRPTEAAPSNLTNQLGQLLGEWTGTRWIVAISQAEGAPTMAEEEARRASDLRHEVAADPLVRAVLETFPGATIAAVRERFVAADVEIEAPPDDIGDEIDDGEASAGEDGS